MPPETAAVTGRCYCGMVRISADQAPQTVTYCHCADCKRVTASPLPTFAAFGEGDVTLTPQIKAAKPVNPGVTRQFCPDCGSQLTARFDYLPGQVYVPLGVLDQAEALAPRLHCHAHNALSWLQLDDGLPRATDSGRDLLQD